MKSGLRRLTDLDNGGGGCDRGKSGKSRRMDAITLLKADHKTVEQLFKRFEKTGDRAYVEQREIVDRIIEELSIHAAVEEQLFYPVARAGVAGTEDIALESLEEHHIVKWVLSELEKMLPEDERFKAKVTVLMENVRHHVKEEEEEFFPKVRDELGRNALNDLGNAMEAAKKVAPTHPHPRSPDTPPGNMVIGSAVGVADRIGDTVSGLAQGGVSAVGDIIAAVLGRKKPKVSPTGSRVARKTATQVRTGVPAAAKNAKKAGARTATAAKRGATTTARTARTGVKSTATSARKSTTRTTTTAKRAATSTGRAARAAVKGTATAAGRSTKKAASSTKRSTRSR